MNTVFKNSKLMQKLKKDLHEEHTQTMHKHRVPFEQWSEYDKANQRYVENIHNSCAELYGKYSGGDSSGR